MRARTFVVVLILLLVLVFAALNWTAFTTPAVLNLGFTTFEAPLGVVMLGFVALITLVFVVYLAVWQTGVLMESRRHTKEMQAQRTLADQAEASRFTELSTLMRQEFERLEDRFASSQNALRQEMRENTNSLAAMLGQVDDTMQQRRLGRPE